MLCAHGLSDGHMNCYLSYLSNQQTTVSILDNFPLPFEVLSAVPQESVLGHLLFNILSKDFVM